MRFKSNLSKTVYIIILAALLLALAVLFLAERKQGQDYYKKYQQELEADNRNTQKFSEEDEVVKEDTSDEEEAKDASEEDVTEDTSAESSKDKDSEKKGAEDKDDADEESAAAEDSDSQSSAAADGVFATLKTSVHDSLPGIVCWGDSNMAGGKEGSLPAAMYASMNDKMFGGIRSELSGSSDSIDTDELNIPVINMGVAHEGFREMLVRSGAHELFLGQDYTIPAEKEKKKVVLCDDDGHAMRFAKAGLELFGQVTIGKVKGSFSEGQTAYDEYRSDIMFSRNEKGEETSVQEGTVVHMEGADKYRDYLPVIFLGAQEDTSVDELAEGIEDIVKAYNKEQYVVVASGDADASWVARCQDTFKGHFLQVEKSAADMKAADYDELAEKVCDSFTEQGAFSGVTEAVEEAENSLS